MRSRLASLEIRLIGQSLLVATLVGCLSTPATPSPTAPSNNPQPVLLITGEWAPYTSEKMEKQGAFTELVSAVFQAMGVPVQYEFAPWKRAEEDVKAGRAFATFPYIQTAERLQTYDFSDPVFISTGKLFYLPAQQGGVISYTTFADLQPYRIGGVLGYWYETPFAEAGLQVDYAKSDELNFQKLYEGRVDLAASEELVGWTLIRQLHPQAVAQFATVDKPLNKDPLRLMISKTYPEAAPLTQKFNAALQQLQADGTYQRILESYGLKP